MDWSAAIVQWLHIICGTFWFGGVLFSDFVVIPAIMAMPADGQAAIGGQIGRAAGRIVPWVATATIVLGILRGTVWGDIRSLADLGTGYGILWVVGLLAAIATFAWGMLVLNPAAERLNVAGGAGASTTAATTDVAKVQRLAQLELLGFIVVFTTMILMHFVSEA